MNIFVRREGTARAFFMVDNELLDVFGRDLGVNGIAVYCALNRFADNGTIAVSYATIAKIINLSERTVMRTIQDMLEKRFLMKRERTGQANVFILADIKKKVEEMKSNLSPLPPVESVEKQEDLFEKGDKNTVVGVTHEGDTAVKFVTHINTYSKNNTKTPAAAPQEGDDWHRIIRCIDTAYRKVNSTKPGWNAEAMGKLKRLVKSKPEWTAENWCRCILNRFASKNVNLGEAPETFIPRLKDYAAGPLNKFGTIETGEKHGRRSNEDAAEEAKRRVDARYRDENEVDY